MNTRVPGRLGALVCAALAAAVIVVLLWFSETLPEPIATHWSFGGEPDGATPRTLLMISLMAPLWLLAGANALVRSPRSRVPLSGLVYALSCLFVVLTWSIVTHNASAPTWRDAKQLSWTHVALATAALLVPLAVHFRVYAATWMQSSGVGEAAPPLSLRPGERVVWLGSARNRWLWLLVVPATASVLFTSHRGPFVLWISLLAAVSAVLLADAFSYLRVRIDRGGVTLTYGRLGWLSQRIALADIEHAETFDLVPLEHGGWGYRGSLRWLQRAAVVVRAGAALRLYLTRGRQFCVTVDAPVEGASLLNGLLAR